MRSKRKEIILSVLVVVVSLGIYYYLFGRADRKIVFLYEHLGFKPFDEITTGRYWMTGLVVSGFLTMVYLISRLILLFMIKPVQISWKFIVMVSAIPLMIGVLLITMTLGEPKMTFLIAISSALALTIGIAIGFSVVDDWVKDYKSTFIYLVFGIGLVPFLLFFRVIELPQKGLLAMDMALLVIVFSVAGGIFWLVLFYRIFKPTRPGRLNVVKGTMAIGYVALPFLHYLIATPKGIPYITTADNFFPENMILRVANWCLLLSMVFLVDKLIKRKTAGV